jgi:hypothetical protein
MLAGMRGQILARSVLALLLLHLAACSTLQPVNIERAMQGKQLRGVEYGSLVQVKTLDRRSVRFRVTEISDDGLGGSEGFFPYAEMKSLKVEEPGASSDEVWGWILGALAVAGLIALAASAENVSICSPGPCPEPQ